MVFKESNIDLMPDMVQIRGDFMKPSLELHLRHKVTYEHGDLYTQAMLRYT